MNYCVKSLRTSFSRNHCAFFASEGALSCLQWARGEGYPSDVMTCAKAAEGGHLEVLKWAQSNLQSQWCPWNSKSQQICANAAARRGHLEVLKWARSQGCPWDAKRTCASAAEGGHLEVLQWLRMLAGKYFGKGDTVE